MKQPTKNTSTSMTLIESNVKGDLKKNTLGYHLSILVILLFLSCQNKAQQQVYTPFPAVYLLDDYLPLLEKKRVGLTVNHSSLIGRRHLTDSLLSHHINIVKVFTPEHGFAGTISDGVKINYSDTEAKPFELVSLYGKNKKPTNEQMDGIDVMVFDIQDVGTRFYTYISTMHYVMEACAENEIPFIVLDRPNPNGSYVAGPVLDTAYRSFVGMHPLPIVHGMTIGELATMINDEGWLSGQRSCDLTVVRMKSYQRSLPYSLPVKPSPNLPNDLSIALYPSLCLFEGTIMSVGRGTDHAFQVVGHPEYPDTTYSFVPQPREGAKWPPYENIKCYGKSWINEQPTYRFSIAPLVNAYHTMKTDTFFNAYFSKLAGTDQLEKQIEAGMKAPEIEATWAPDLDVFKKKRDKYLLYR